MEEERQQESNLKRLSYVTEQINSNAVIMTNDKLALWFKYTGYCQLSPEIWM